MDMQPHPLALELWLTEQGCEQLIQLWENDAGKHEAEAIVGKLVSELPRHSMIVDLGCGNARLVACLPPFRRYVGVDFSEPLLSWACNRYGADKRVRFKLDDFVIGQPLYRQRQDVVLCVHVARHYSDPLALLRGALRWPARYYVFSVLHGPTHQELLNGVIVATAELDAAIPQIGRLLQQIEQPGANETSVRYFSLEVPDIAKRRPLSTQSVGGRTV
jgi:SAM-dependent methyltransferase